MMSPPGTFLEDDRPILVVPDLATARYERAILWARLPKQSTRYGGRVTSGDAWIEATEEEKNELASTDVIYIRRWILDRPVPAVLLRQHVTPQLADAPVLSDDIQAAVAAGKIRRSQIL